MAPRHGVSGVVFLAVLRGISSRDHPKAVLKLGAPGVLDPVTGTDYRALGIHPLPIPGCAKGAGIYLGFLGVSKPLHRDRYRCPE